jgi:hypothetical protein
MPRLKSDFAVAPRRERGNVTAESASVVEARKRRRVVIMAKGEVENGQASPM